MATTTIDTSSLKAALAEHLQCSLSADRAVRQRGEIALTALEANEEFGLALMEISLSEGVLDFDVRHLAAVVLDGYISRHWAEFTSSLYTGPPVAGHVRPQLRAYLLKSLTLSGPPGSSSVSGGGGGIHGPTKRLLSSYAHSLAKIAATDWPSDWPDLFPALVGYLASDSPSTVFSTLAVFSELAHEIADMQIAAVAPILLPAMLDIFTSSSPKSGLGGPIQTLRHRTTAITVFVTLAETILLMGEYQKEAIRMFLEPHMPRYLEAVIAVLAAPETSGQVDVALKAAVISGLTKLLKCGGSGARRLLKGALPRLMELVWRALTTAAPAYVQRVVNSTSFDRISSLQGSFDFYSGDEDEDGRTSFEALLYAILDFVRDLFESTAKYRTLIKPVLADLLYHALLLVQLTDEQTIAWTDDLEQFLEDDDLDSASYSVRLSAQDLLMALAKELAVSGRSSTSSGSSLSPSKKRLEEDRLFKTAFLAATQRHFALAGELEKAGSPAWWKAVEACLYSLGMIAPTVIWTINQDGGELAAGYQAILDSVLGRSMSSASVGSQATPFLAGRSLWTAARFSPIMNDVSLEAFLAMTAQVLSGQQTSKSEPGAGILKISALRATYYFCDNVAVNDKVHVIRPHLPATLHGLIGLGLGATSETLYLVLQTIAILLKLDSSFTASVAAPITSLATSAFLQFPDDPTVFVVALDLLDELLKPEVGEGVAGLVAERLLPTIVSVLGVAKLAVSSSVSVLLKTASGGDELRSMTSQAALSLQPEAVDLLSHLLRAKSKEVPLSEDLVGVVYPALMAALAAATPEDSALLQNGSEAVRWFVVRGGGQLSGRSFQLMGAGGSTSNGIALALNFCHHLLSPGLPESCSTYVGRLAVVLISQAQAILGPEAVQQLLKAVLVKLSVARELPLVQSLVLVFAHLFYSENLAFLLGYLAALPAPEVSKAAEDEGEAAVKWSSSLAFLLDRWLAVQLLYVGYENKAAVVALCRLFAHSLEGNGQSGGSTGQEQQLNLHRIEVTDDGVSSTDQDGEAIRTRYYEAANNKNRDDSFSPSKGEKKVTVMVPATVKMLKLLISEYQHMLELKEAIDAKFSDDDYDDDDDDDDDEDDEGVDDRKLLASLQGFDSADQKIIDLTDLLLEDGGSDGVAGGDDDDEEKWEILSPEIDAISLEVALQEVLRGFKAAPVAGEFVAHLTSCEREVLAGL